MTPIFARWLTLPMRAPMPVSPHTLYASENVRVFGCPAAYRITISSRSSFPYAYQLFPGIPVNPMMEEKPTNSFKSRSASASTKVGCAQDLRCNLLESRSAVDSLEPPRNIRPRTVDKPGDRPNLDLDLGDDAGHRRSIRDVAAIVVSAQTGRRECPQEWEAISSPACR